MKSVSVCRGSLVVFLGMQFGSLSPPAQADPAAGTWHLNVAKSKYDPGAGPEEQCRRDRSRRGWHQGHDKRRGARRLANGDLVFVEPRRQGLTGARHRTAGLRHHRSQADQRQSDRGHAKAQGQGCSDLLARGLQGRQDPDRDDDRDQCERPENSTMSPSTRRNRKNASPVRRFAPPRSGVFCCRSGSKSHALSCARDCLRRRRATASPRTGSTGSRGSCR